MVLPVVLQWYSLLIIKAFAKSLGFITSFGDVFYFFCLGDLFMEHAFSSDYRQQFVCLDRRKGPKSHHFKSNGPQCHLLKKMVLIVTLKHSWSNKWVSIETSSGGHITNQGITWILSYCGIFLLTMNTRCTNECIVLRRLGQTFKRSYLQGIWNRSLDMTYIQN